MAITNKSKEWERKNSLYVLLGLFPFLNSLAYFHMNSRVPNPKMKKMGWICLFINIFVAILVLLALVADSQLYNWIPMPEKNYSYVSESDYFGNNYYDYSDEELLTHPNYEEYSKAYKEYQQNQNDYLNSAEYKAAQNSRQRVGGTIGAVTVGLIITQVVFNIVILFSLVSQRADFLRALAQREDRGQLASRLGPQAQSNAPSAANIPPAAPQYQPPVNAQYQPQANAQYQPPVNTQYQPQVPNTQYQPPMPNTQPVQAGNPNALDLNSATEEQLTALPGLTVIDAKKAIEYRTEHGGFSSKDEFFNAISIKPHIMVRIDPLVYTGAVSQTEAKSGNHGSGRRTIDF
ncbi:MAG: helix-hairpin-helix domain-containing protein [Clostridia bacterium]|nr:helix-hairpin-helix domain-containing protein [Clostridia bacterium]